MYLCNLIVNIAEKLPTVLNLSWYGDANLRPWSRDSTGLRFEPPHLHFECPWPSAPAFHSNADPDPASKNNADPDSKDIYMSCEFR